MYMQAWGRKLSDAIGLGWVWLKEREESKRQRQTKDGRYLGCRKERAGGQASFHEPRRESAGQPNSVEVPRVNAKEASCKGVGWCETHSKRNRVRRGLWGRIGMLHRASQIL